MAAGVRVSTDERGTHPRELARRFAAVLAEHRAAWELQYWPAGGMPWPVAAGDAATEHVHAAMDPAAASATVAAPATVAPPASGARLPIADATAADAARAVVTQSATDLRDRAAQWDTATKLEYLRRRNVGDCQRCALSRTRTNIVFGVGNPEARIMFVGEAPGADEDRQGEPFVGRAGQRLNQWLTTLGLSRADVYIANVLKCRPPGNRDPRPEEVDRCSPFLQAQIRAIAPAVLVALGRHAGMLLSKRDDLSLRAMRGATLHYEVQATGDRATAHRIPIVVTYHPAYVLRQEGSEGDGEAAERLVMQDLERALAWVRSADAPRS